MSALCLALWCCFIPWDWHTAYHSLDMPPSYLGHKLMCAFSTFLVGQHLPTLTTWVLLTPVHLHVYHQPVVCFKGLLTHRTVLGLPWDSRDFVRNINNLPGLSPLVKVLPMKKAETCCLTCFSALFFTTTSSSAGQALVVHEPLWVQLQAHWNCVWLPWVKLPNPPPRPH